MADLETFWVRPDPGVYACKRIAVIDADGAVVREVDVVPGEWNDVGLIGKGWRVRGVPLEHNRTGPERHAVEHFVVSAHVPLGTSMPLGPDAMTEPPQAIEEAGRAQAWCPTCESRVRWSRLNDADGQPCGDPMGWHTAEERR